MEPLKPETKERILGDRPDASPEDIQEYERLLAERFTVDPDLPRSPERQRAADAREERLGQLYQKLFGRGPADAEPRAAGHKAKSASRAGPTGGGGLKRAAYRKA